MAKKKKPASTEPIKNPLGRPPKYDIAFHPSEVIRLGKEGRSKAQMCSAFGIARETLYDWERKHKEFSDALKIAAEHREAFWTSFGMQIATGRLKGNPTMFIWMSKNIISWKDKVEVTQDPDSDPIFSIDGVPLAEN